MENLNEEIWRKVVGYEESYEVSNYARVRSIERFKKGRSGCDVPQKGRMLNIDCSSRYLGYIKPRVTLYRNGKHKKFNVSVIVARAFPEICGEWFEGCDVHHIDENPENNLATNLKVLTKEEHTKIHILSGKFNGERNPFYGKHHSNETIKLLRNQRRKPIYQYSLDGVCLCYWFSCTDCERETGMKKSAINKCCMGKKKTHHNYIWKYAKEGEN